MPPGLQVSFGKLDVNVEITDGLSHCDKLNGPLAVGIYSCCSFLLIRYIAQTSIYYPRYGYRHCH